MKWRPRPTPSRRRAPRPRCRSPARRGGSFGPALDNVVITETLATGADCKKGGWQTMVDSTGTSFRNQGDCVSYYATGEKNLAF